MDGGDPGGSISDRKLWVEKGVISGEARTENGNTEAERLARMEQIRLDSKRMCIMIGRDKGVEGV